MSKVVFSERFISYTGFRQAAQLEKNRASLPPFGEEGGGTGFYLIFQ